MTTLHDLATEIHHIRLPDLPGCHVTVYLFALGPSTWQWAMTTSAPGWGTWGCDRRGAGDAQPNPFCAISLALCFARNYWEGRGVDQLALAIVAAADELWL